MIEVSHITVKYADCTALRDVSLTIPSGALTVIAGPNGCGKSTLLKRSAASCRARRERSPSTARRSRALPTPRAPSRISPRTAPCPTSRWSGSCCTGAFPISPTRAGMDKTIFASRARPWRRWVFPASPTRRCARSGGVRQKVYLAMALAQDTPVVLLDEPTTYLDVAHQFSTMERAKALCAAGKTVVAVLHDLLAAMRCADKLVVMENGGVAAQGTCAEIFESGCIDRVFGVSLRKMDTPDGEQFYLVHNAPSMTEEG